MLTSSEDEVRRLAAESDGLKSGAATDKASLEAALATAEADKENAAAAHLAALAEKDAVAATLHERIDAFDAERDATRAKHEADLAAANAAVAEASERRRENRREGRAVGRVRARAHGCQGETEETEAKLLEETRGRNDAAAELESTRASVEELREKLSRAESSRRGGGGSSRGDDGGEGRRGARLGEARARGGAPRGYG